MDYCKNCKRWTCGAQGTSHEMSIPCGNYIPPTNADRIRSMTDEELADFLNSVMIDATRHGSLGSPLHACGGEGVRTLDWLKQGVEDDG